MNKKEFLRKLRSELSRLPEEEREDAIRYYEEYIDDAGEENEEKAVSELGNPAKIATQIKADYAVKQLGSNKNAANNNPKTGITAIFWIILGIFAAPVALPFAIVGGVLAIVLFATFIAIVISILISIIAVFGAGILAFIAGVSLIVVDFSSAILSMGLGLCFVGGTLLLGTGVILGTRAIIRAIARSASARRQRKIIKKQEDNSEII